MRALLLSVLCIFGCAQSQDLGHDSPPPSVESEGITPTTTGDSGVAEVTPASAIDVCPAISPIDGAQCSLNVPWCRYGRTDGFTNRCACGLDKRWVCLVVADSPLRDLTAQFPVTNASCTEGAPCGEGVRCTIPRVRTCTCMSSSRFVCSKPAE